jgi:hypothetical protein
MFDLTEENCCHDLGKRLPSSSRWDNISGCTFCGTAAAQNANPTLSSGQILDLWQDVLAARGRQQKQQDTINRIIKFLAGVFGQHVNRGRGSCGWAAWEGRWY